MVRIASQPGLAAETANSRDEQRVPIIQCRLDSEHISSTLGNGLSPRVADLLDVAKYLYAVDRLVRRHRRSFLKGQTRDAYLEIGVREPDFWQSKQVASVLQKAVHVVSDDSVTLKFYRASFADSEPMFSLPITEANVTPRLCLYSGGLDSLAGLANQIRQDQTPVVTVTAWHQASQRGIIHDQLLALRQRYGVPIFPVIAKAALVQPPRMAQQELTQRWRSFLFLALGAAAASLVGASEVEIYESGVGAVNLPLMAGMLVGARTTKGCHPQFLRLMSELVTHVIGRPISFTLPFSGCTKGEIVKHLLQDGLSVLAQTSMSCVHFPLRDSETYAEPGDPNLWKESPTIKRHIPSAAKQCGVCPGCIGRRQAFFVAGHIEPQGTYKHDLFQSALPIADEELDYLKACLMQVDELGNLAPGQPLPRRFAQHVYGSGVLRPGESPEAIICLLRRYRHEWLELIRYGRSQGWTWCELLPE